MSDRSTCGVCLAAAAAVALLGLAGAAQAQSTASTYSYGTYNPVQAAINRDSMNAAILKQAGAHKPGKKTAKQALKRHKKAG